MLTQHPHITRYAAGDIVRQSTPQRSCSVYGPHPRWRRLTGITFAIEFRLSKKERKKACAA
jgi:hypothetical protein